MDNSRIVITKHYNNIGVLECVDFAWEGESKIVEIGENTLMFYSKSNDGGQHIMVGPYKLRFVDHDLMVYRYGYLQVNGLS